MLGIPLVHLCLEFLKTNALLYAELHFVWFVISLHKEL